MKEWKNRIYDSYLSNGFKNAHNMRDEFELHRKYFKKNYLKHMPSEKDKVILDLGCGMGQFLYFCKKEGYKNCIGVDGSRQNIEYIKRRGFLSMYQLYQGSIMDFLKGKDSCYDVIVLNDVLEHLEKDEIFGLMDAVARALKCGGRFFIKTPNMANPFVAAAGRYIDITHEIGVTQVSITQVLKATGFQNIKVVGTDIYVLNPAVSVIAKMASKMVNMFLYTMSALYGRTSITIYEKDLLAVACKHGDDKC